MPCVPLLKTKRHGLHTIEDVCHAYVDHLKMQKTAASAADAEGGFKRLVYGAIIGHIQLSKLKTTDVKKWLNGQFDDGAGLYRTLPHIRITIAA